jgi:hypothetical protein
MVDSTNALADLRWSFDRHCAEVKYALKKLQEESPDPCLISQLSVELWTLEQRMSALCDTAKQKCAKQPQHWSVLNKSC